MYTIRYLKPESTAATALNSKVITIDGETDTADIADWLCNDSTVGYDALLWSTAERGLPEYGVYLAAIYPQIKSGRKPGNKVKTNLTIDKDLREKAARAAEFEGLSLSGYIEKLIRQA